MKRSNVRSRKRIACKHLVPMLLLSFLLTLSFALITASIGVAQDECMDTGRVANGGTEWYFPGFDTFPAVSGRSEFHMQECHHDQLAKGWVYVLTSDSGDWFVVSTSVEGGAVKIVYSDSWWALDEYGNNVQVAGEAAWGVGQIIDASDSSIVGMWGVLAAFDGGTPGRNGDILFQITPLPQPVAQSFYDMGINGIQVYPFWALVVKGNVVVK